MEDRLYVSVVFPLALPELYTYEVPKEFLTKIAVGVRVEVELKRKRYSAIVYKISDQYNHTYKPKSIISILDIDPIVNQKDLELWRWVAMYYCCTLGEVMQMAMPSGLKLESETVFIAVEETDPYEFDLSDDEFLIAEALNIRKEIKIQEARDILNRKSIYPIIRDLLDKNIVEIKENLVTKYAPKKINVVSLVEELVGNSVKQIEKLDLLRGEKQKMAFLAIIQLAAAHNSIPVASIYEMAKVNISVLRGLEKKGYINILLTEVSRIEAYVKEEEELPPLSQEQEKGLSEIYNFHEKGLPTLIHGVTGSGKTRMYIQLIEDCIAKGRQALYLLPEIALTSQMINRLKGIFGENIIVYHSRMSSKERVEMWTAVLKGKAIVLGARSSLFLPFKNLGLIIVDEEHDPSYKQYSPAPRYNARDCAIVVAKQNKAMVVLGSATPSIDSFYNAQQNKYGLVSLTNRYGSSKMPMVEIVDMAYEKKTKRLKSIISFPLIEEIKKTIAEGNQVILFQNRRGYAPVIHCNQCGWVPKCINCDVSMTLHRFFDDIRCHYCRHKRKNPLKCDECGSDDLTDLGSGTQRIESEIKTLIEDVKVVRLDWDTAKGKTAYEKILVEFEQGKYNILVGTQMVTKGFDFEKVTLVGVVNADSMLQIPDFRANERAFQLMTQVAGRAGRREDMGKVLIQAYKANHLVLADVIEHNYDRFYRRELFEREKFRYPPFNRIIMLELKHKDVALVKEAAQIFSTKLRQKLGGRVSDPVEPAISRIRNMYIRNITIKLEKDPKLIGFTKKYLMHLKGEIRNAAGIKSLRVNIDVDPI